MNSSFTAFIKSYPGLLAVCVLCFSALACSREDDPGNSSGRDGKGADPIERPLGTPSGAAVVKQIGPEGGLLNSEDGAIQILVPPGTVDKAVDFSIQPITNTLEGGLGMAYRLLPENEKFSKPVEIIYNLDGMDIPEDRYEVLFMAYQNDKGHHYLAADTKVDKAQKKLTVKTSHFSDWSVAQLFELEVGKVQVAVGDTARVRLMWQMGSLLAPLTTDQPIGDLIEYGANTSTLRWSIGYGKGTIRATGATCVYTAPETVPSENPAQVSVTVPVSLYTKQRASVVMMTTPIFTTPDEYMIIKVDGKEMKNRPRQNREGFIFLDANSFYVQAQLENGHGIGVHIPDGSGTGNYPFGPDFKQAYLEYVTDEPFPNSWLSEKSDCYDCETVYSGGHVQITKFGSEGDYVEGEFTGEVWRMGQYGPPRKKIEGKFRAFRAP